MSTLYGREGEGSDRREVLGAPESVEGALPRGRGGGKVILSKVILVQLLEGLSARPGGSRPPPPPRTKWTRRVPHPVLIGHAASLTQPVARATPYRAEAPLCRPPPRSPSRADRL